MSTNRARGVFALIGVVMALLVVTVNARARGPGDPCKTCPTPGCSVQDEGVYDCVWYPCCGFCAGSGECPTPGEASAGLLTAGGAVVVGTIKATLVALDDAEQPRFDRRGVMLLRNCADEVVAHAYSKARGESLRSRSKVVRI